MNNEMIQKRIADGGLKPNQHLTNMSVAYFQDASEYIATSVFPVVPVELSSGNYSIFSKEDLARDNVHRKPEFGHVDPAIVSSDKGHYHCEVDQIIMGIDKIQQVNADRMSLVGASNPKVGMSKAIAEQILIHLDKIFSEKYFSKDIWGKELKGNTTTDITQNQFTKFSDANSEPIKMFRALATEIHRETRRRPNTLIFGVEAYDALLNHPDILDRIKMGGSSANPAIANEQVLAELFGVQRVFQATSTMNTAAMGQEAKMEYICDPKSALLCYTTPTPSIDTPTAGYIFTWDPLGNGSPITVNTSEGNPLDHTQFIEGIASYDMHQVAKDLGVFLTECV